MRSKGMLITALSCLGAMAVLGQTPAPAPAAQTGPGVQAPNDSKFQAYVTANCKNPPAPRGGGAGRGAAAGGAAGAGGAGRGAAAGPPVHREYKVPEIPGVIAAGQMWKTVWTGTGNNADGPIGTSDGGMMFAQNSNSKVMKLDKNGKVSFPYSDTNTGGAISMNKKGALFIVERGLPQEIWQLAPKRQLLANKYMGNRSIAPLGCSTTLAPIARVEFISRRAASIMPTRRAW